jgi:cytoskeletal protein CcmA (bactofilin family)
MFGKEATETQGTINTILGHDCNFTGNNEAKGSVRIDGDFEGKVTSSDSVIVGKCGMV